MLNWAYNGRVSATRNIVSQCASFSKVIADFGFLLKEIMKGKTLQPFYVVTCSNQLHMHHALLNYSTVRRSFLYVYSLCAVTLCRLTFI